MKKVLYSCITGGYDAVPEYKFVAPGWDYVLFTDNKKLIRAGRVAHWTVRPLMFSAETNVKNARWHKVNAHKLFPEYDYSLWVDSNIIINNPKPFKMMDDLIEQNVLVAVPNHMERHCIYAEAQIIKEYHIEWPDIVDDEMRYLRKDNYPENNGLSETNILLRKHNAMRTALDLWWKMIAEFSKRDQLSFNYAMWKYGIEIRPIYTGTDGLGYHRECPDFTFVKSKTHNQNKVNQPHNHSAYSFGVRIIAMFIPFSKYRRQLKDKLLRGLHG